MCDFGYEDRWDEGENYRRFKRPLYDAKRNNLEYPKQTKFNKYKAKIAESFN